MVSELARSALILIAAIAVSLLDVQSASIYDDEISEEILDYIKFYGDISNLIDDEYEGEGPVPVSIPMSLYREMDKVMHTTEFINKFVLNDTELEKEYRNKTLSNIAKNAGCSPRDTVVFFDLSVNSNNIFYYPKGTIVKRCGGCCTNSIRFSCQPVDKENVHLKVLKLEYTNRVDQLLTFKEFENITLEQHTKCKCDCTEKLEDCNDRQIYYQEVCKCFCKEILKCDDPKRWNETFCECRCKQPQTCTSGSVFDETTCECTVDKNLIHPHRVDDNCPNSYEKAECKKKYWNSKTCACEMAETKSLERKKHLIRALFAKYMNLIRALFAKFLLDQDLYNNN